MTMPAFVQDALTGLGRSAWEQWRRWRHLAAVAFTVLPASLQPRHWPRTVRNVFARQLLATGVESVFFVSFLGVLVGVTVVVETYHWLDKVGLSRQTGSLLVVLVARELGPLFVNFIVLVRSGSVMASELGVMQVSGEVRALEAQGIEPFLYLLMPRVLAMTVATISLTAVFNAVAFASGYGFGVFSGVMPEYPEVFLNNVFKTIEADDVLNILAKSLVPAWLAAVICCTEGLGAGGSLIDVPLATKRALRRSVAAIFVSFLVISLLTYR